MKTRIDIKPLSVNDAWKGRRFRTDKYKQYTRDLLFLLPNIKLPDPPYEVHYTWGFSSASSDTGNPEKPFTDILAKKYGFNDKVIDKIVQTRLRVPKGGEFIEFEIIHFNKENRC